MSKIVNRVVKLIEGRGLSCKEVPGGIEHLGLFIPTNGTNAIKDFELLLNSPRKWVLTDLNDTLVERKPALYDLIGSALRIYVAGAQRIRPSEVMTLWDEVYDKLGSGTEVLAELSGQDRETAREIVHECMDAVPMGYFVDSDVDLSLRLERLMKNGVFLGLVTSFPLTSARRILKALGIEGDFNLMQCGTEKKDGKGWESAYAALAKKFGIDEGLDFSQGLIIGNKITHDLIPNRFEGGPPVIMIDRSRIIPEMDAIQARRIWDVINFVLWNLK